MDHAFKRLAAALVCCIAVHSSVYAETIAKPSNCPIFSEYLGDDALQQALKARLAYLNQCLSCAANSCFLDRKKIQTTEMLSSCKVLFCTPTKLRKTEFSENSWGSFAATVHYKINADGKGELEKVEFTSGKLPQRHQREVKKVLSKRLRRTKWEPILVDGEAKSLSRLLFHYRFKGGLTFF